MNNSDIYKKLKLICENAKKSKELKNYNSYKVRSKAEYFVEVKSPYLIIALINFAKDKGIKYHILGGGTNVLLSDDRVNGLVIYTGKLNAITKDENFITAESGASIEDVNNFALKNGLAGTEFSKGLPGTIGGAVFMNARCYGKEFSEIVEEIEYIDSSLNVKKMKHNEMYFSYKSSPFQDTGRIITKVKLKLEKKNKAEIKKAQREVYLDRKSRHQYEYPSAGCVFMNDRNIGIPTGKLIEMLGLKGLKEGGAEVAPFHANFIINRKNAKAKDIFILMNKIRIAVKDKKGFQIKPEIRLMGNWD